MCGQADQLVPEERTRGLLAAMPNARMLQHKGAHMVCTCALFSSPVVVFLLLRAHEWMHALV